MNDQVHIPLRAVVAENEKAAVKLAAAQLERALGEAANAPVTISCEFGVPEEDLVKAEAGSIVVTSLLPDAIDHHRPWIAVAERLQAFYDRLAAGEGASVFICTVFRHVPTGEDTEEALLRRIRIRRLNFLAAELSRSTGAYVIDIDRSLADIGARNLETDYLLTGSYGQEAAAKFIALAILSAGLDAYVPFEIQDVARAAIARSAVKTVEPSAVSTELQPSNIVMLGADRRKQAVKMIVDTNKENHAGRLIELLLNRQFGLGEAFAKLRGSVARRGLWPSVMMVFAAVRHMLRSHAGLGR